MEEVSLTETETRYYSDLFLCCDEEKTGKIPMLKASELYRSANLSNEKILEITSLAGIPDTALHVSRVQFYSCLKLIAAHQASVPLRQELIAASVQLPLPRFTWIDLPSSEIDMTHSYQQHHHSMPPSLTTEKKNSLKHLYKWTDSNTLGARRNSLSIHQPEPNIINSDLHSTDSEIEQGESNCEGEKSVVGVSGHNKHHRGGVSPEAWSTNSDSPTPTNSVADRPWAKESLWHGLLGDEHRQLLATEEESSDRHSSDEENEADLEAVYQITPEQREYYFKQFKAVQQDPNGLLSGPVARVFFEKSRIPIEELRHIWQLCDVTRDGALSLSEFIAAMHLVVLRRNNIPLPQTLPVCLHPKTSKHVTVNSNQTTSQTDPPEADLLHLDDDDDEDNTDNTVVGVNPTLSGAVRTSAVNSVVGNNKCAPTEKNTTSTQAIVNSRQGANLLGCSTKSLTPPIIPPPPPLKLPCSLNKPLSPPIVLPIPPLQRLLHSPKAAEAGATTATPPPINLGKEVQSNQWTKFNESPTSNISSPGPKPVNFDMQRTAQAVVSDPQILHPVPLRVTPVAAGTLEKQIIETDLREPSPKPSSVTNNHGSGVIGSAQSNRDSLQSSDLRAIQRPQAKKLHTKNIGALPPPPQRESTGVNISNANSVNDAVGIIGGTCVYTTSASMVANKKDIPPLPPPRPHRHGRSSSLDLNKFKICTSGGQQAEMTAQTSFDLQTSTGFADFTHFPDGNSIHAVNDQQSQQIHSMPPQNITGRCIQTTSVVMPPTSLSLQSNQRISAFEVYRKPFTSGSSQSPSIFSTNAAISGIPSKDQSPTPFGSAAATAMAITPLQNSEQYEKRVNVISERLRHVSFKDEQSNIIEVLRHLREQNSLLIRLCNDLSDELLSVQTCKEELRLKLEENTSANTTVNDLGNIPNMTTSTMAAVVRSGSSISAPVTVNNTGGSGSSGVHSNV